ncbi:MAG: hypothetical protein J7K37_01260 [Candidatus Omnitrophica bacterium]|nr:hypothetical protein [Candidatus Omnitrophota bacterium]
MKSFKNFYHYKGKILRLPILTLVLFNLGCVKARDYFSAKKGALRMNVVFSLGEGKESRNYIVVDDVVIDRGDTKKIVQRKLGKPSWIGITLEGWQFYRYEDKQIEIYFDNDRVVGFKRLEFQP